MKTRRSKLVASSFTFFRIHLCVYPAKFGQKFIF